MLIILLYAFSFIFLFLNQSQYIFGGDSAEFSLVAKTWSIAHPPGYPFYSLLISLINRIVPFGTTPWKIATVSSLSTVIASYIIMLMLKKLKVNPFISVLASLIYIFLFPIWHYSEIPEVFTLHNLLVISITYLLILFIEKNDKRFMYASAFLCGLCISHHHIFVLFVPAWAYLLFHKKNGEKPIGRLNKRDFIRVILLLFLGVSFYIYAPIASSFSPPLDWENPKTLTGFFRLITRSAYGTFKAYSGSSGNIVGQFYNIISVFIFMLMDFRIIGTIFVIVGMFFYPVKKSPYYRFLLIALGTHMFFLFYTNFPLTTSFVLAMYERFLIPLYLILVFFLAFGLQIGWNFLDHIIKKHVRNRSLGAVSRNFFPFFMVLYLSTILIQNYRTIRHFSSLQTFAAYGKNLLDAPPKNSIFFVGGDNSHFTSLYYHFGENYRPDLKFIFINLLNKPHYRDTVKKEFPEIIIPANNQSRPYVLDFVKANKTYGVYLGDSYGSSWIPYGLLWKYYESEEQAISDSARLVEENNNLWQNIYEIPRLDDDLKKILHLNVIYGQYINAYMNYSRLLFAAGHVAEAKDVLASISSKYQKSDLRTKFIQVNLFLYEGNCSGARAIVQSIPQEDVLNQYNILPSFKDYLKKCETNPSAKDTIRRIEEIERSMKTSISEL